MDATTKYLKAVEGKEATEKAIAHARTAMRLLDELAGTPTDVLQAREIVQAYNNVAQAVRRLLNVNNAFVCMKNRWSDDYKKGRVERARQADWDENTSVAYPFPRD